MIIRRVLAVFFCLIFLFSCRFYRSYQILHKQTPTFANIQAMCLIIDDILEEKSCISVDEMREVSRRYNEGRDSWGNSYLFSIRETDQAVQCGCSYLVVSMGKDGELDVDNIEEYFDHKEEYVVGELNRDIVFCDGKPILIASPK